MIRPITCVCVLLAGGSGLYLYQSKHRVQMLDRQIEATVRATQAARERTGVLRAEWTLLNDPERLAQLADRFLALKTVAPPQFTTMAELGNRLPAVKVPNPNATDDLPEEPVVDQIALAPEAAEPKPAAKPSAKPVAVAIAAPRPERPAATERSAAERKAQLALNSLQLPSQPAIQRVSTRSLVASGGASAPLAAPVPVARPIQAAYSPGTAYAPPRLAARPAAPEPVAPHVVGSALSMGRTTLAAPVPYNDANGN